MLFNKKIEPQCVYCKYGTQLDEEDAICVKRGIVNLGGSCRSFRYEPLKRMPMKPVSLDTSKYSKQDFAL